MKWLDVLAGRVRKGDNEFLLVLPAADQNAFLLVSGMVVTIRSPALTMSTISSSLLLHGCESRQAKSMANIRK